MPLDAKSLLNITPAGSLSLRDRKKPFTFKFQRISAGSVKNGGEIVLMAYINNISDSSSPEWDERLDIGRADAKILYKSFSRTISLSFTVAVESELNPMQPIVENQLDNILASNSANRSITGVERSRVLSDPSVNKLSDKIVGGAIQRATGTEYATRDVAINLNTLLKHPPYLQE
jgi:hypothetical protein